MESINLFDLYAKITLDTGEYESGLEDAAKKSAVFANSAESLGDKVKAAGDVFNELVDALENAENAVDDAAKETDTFSDELTEAKKEAEKAKETLDDYNEKLGDTETKSESAGRATSNFADKLKKGLATAGKLAASGIAAAGTAIIGFGKIGLEYNKQMETYTTNFEVMLGDAEAAAKKVEELKKLGAKTPFELGDLAEATQTLLAFNVSADESTSVLTMLGDISLGNAEKLETLTRAYGKMSSSQKVTLEDINMMIDAGFNPLLIIAEQTGETMSQLYDRISDGSMSFEEIQGAMEAATSAGGQFYQGMEKASQTLEGQISTLKDNAEALLGQVFLPISEGLTEKVLPAAVEAIDALTAAYEENGVEGMIGAAGEIIVSAIGTFTEGLPLFVDVAIQILSALVDGLVDPDNLAALGEGVSATIETLISGLVEMAPQLVVAAVMLLLTLAQSLIENVDDLLIAIPTIVESIVVAFKDNWPTFVQIGKDIVTQIWEGFKSLGSWFLDNMDGWLGDVVEGAYAGIYGTGPIGLGGGTKFGSHAGGLDYVPYNGYMAQLHRGEMVLTASEAEDYRSGAINRSLNALTGAILANSGGGGVYEINVNIDGESAARVLFDPLKAVVIQRGEALA